MFPSARIEEIRTDREHGASYLARRAVETLIESAEAGEDPLEVARSLAAARPAMGAIAGAVGRVVAAAEDPTRVAQEGRALLASYARASRSIAVLLAPRLAGRVFTFSTSATVEEVLDHARASRVDRLDSSTLVLVGADSVFADGSIVNAFGTRRVAAAAAQAGIPFIVAAETLKLVPGGGVEPAEPLFELTPAELVEAVATEEGLFQADEIGTLVDRTPFLREGFALVAPARVS